MQRERIRFCRHGYCEVSIALFLFSVHTQGCDVPVLTATLGILDIMSDAITPWHSDARLAYTGFILGESMMSRCSESDTTVVGPLIRHIGPSS
jgi:hypothetical protein